MEVEAAHASVNTAEGDSRRVATDGADDARTCIDTANSSTSDRPRATPKATGASEHHLFASRYNAIIDRATPSTERLTHGVSFNTSLSQGDTSLRTLDGRPRNRLESRLEELQRDLANLTIKLRSHSAAKAMVSVDTADHLDEDSAYAIHARESVSARTRAPQRKHTNLPPPATYQAAHSQSSQRQAVPRGNNSLLRNKPKASTSDLEKQLRIVTLERDQLRLELEKAKRSLLARRKKHHEAREMCDILQSQCVELQNSLELSERIRVRQKRLLEQFQHRSGKPHQQKPDKDADSAKISHAKPIAEKRRLPSTTIAENQVSFTGVDIFDSLLQANSSHDFSHPDVLGSADTKANTQLHNRRPRTKRDTERPRSTSKIQQSSGSIFSHLPAVRVPFTTAEQSSIVKPRCVNLKSPRKSQPCQSYRRHFLAPTQASINRMQARHSDQRVQPFRV